MPTEPDDRFDRHSSMMFNLEGQHAQLMRRVLELEKVRVVKARAATSPFVKDNSYNAEQMIKELEQRYIKVKRLLGFIVKSLLYMNIELKVYLLL